MSGCCKIRDIIIETIINLVERLVRVLASVALFANLPAVLRSPCRVHSFQTATCDCSHCRRVEDLLIALVCKKSAMSGREQQKLRVRWLAPLKRYRSANKSGDGCEMRTYARRWEARD